MSKPLIVTIPHQLGKQGAKTRIQDGLGQARAQLGGLGATVEEQWNEDQLAFSVAALGQTLTGRIDVYEESAHVEVDLPWALALLGGKIRDRLQKQGTLMLEKK
ncbi:polyhydroxyalkanoic acid system family protein [Azospirillum sp. sgz301742]